MILVRAPLRVSFMGGGTDIPKYYLEHGGKVISTAINQHVYLAINRTPFINRISVRYSKTESVKTVQELEHNRVRETLKRLNINGNVEIGSFASIPMRTGLGSSSSFTAALIKGLYELLGKEISAKDLAELACEIEIEKLGEPIGKQDQYATSFGGFNVIEFKIDGEVVVYPLNIDNEALYKLQQHTLMFFTGVTRDAKSVLDTQVNDIHRHISSYQRMVEMVDIFSNAIISSDVKLAGTLLDESWKLKKSLAQGITNSTIDKLYEAGMNAGAWGGKTLGAGGGGCVLFLAPPEQHEEIRNQLSIIASKIPLDEFIEIPFEFETNGAVVVFKSSS